MKHEDRRPTPEENARRVEKTVERLMSSPSYPIFLRWLEERDRETTEETETGDE